MKKALLLSLALGTSLLGAVEMKLHAAAEGMLVDANGDGVADVANLDSPQKPLLELLVGKFGKASCRSGIEFQLPADAANIRKATLTLTLNGKSGLHPDQPNTVGPETRLYAYWGTEADGKFALSDDGAGEAIGTILPGDKVLETPLKPVVADVTGAIRQAVAAKAAFIGFRLESGDEKNVKSSWRIRSGVFARLYAPSVAPLLTIITE